MVLEGAPDHHVGMYLMPVGNRTVLVGDPKLAEKLLESSPVRFDAVRQKLAIVMRNKFLGANIKACGIAVDQEAVIAAIARRDIAGAAALVPDEAVEAFAIAGTPQHCTKRLHDFIAAGLDEPVLGLLGSAENCRLALDVMREFVA